MTLGPENLVSLWDKAVPTPPYPSYTLKCDDEGKLLRDMDLKFIPDWTENLKYRLTIQHRAQDHRQFQELQRVWCKSNILYFANVFCWTYDPRLESPYIPIVTYPFQDDVLTWNLWLLKNHETGLIEKSRDMGLTWCEEIIAAYCILFFPGFVDYQMSLREDDVDTRTEDSLLGKLRYLLRNLPEWMRAGWVENENGVDNKMLIKFPDTGGLVRGQLTMGTSGRSGRASRVFNDEFAFVEDADRVLKSLSALAPSTIYGSTPNGMGNAFYVMAHSPNVKKKTLHWRMHPLKNPEWARKERAKITYTDETWAKEQEISYEMSTEGRVFPEFTSFTSSREQWDHIQDGTYYEYDPFGDVDAWMDYGIGDPTAVLFVQRRESPLDFKQCYDQTGALVNNHTLVVFDCAEATNRDYKWWAALLKERGYNYREFVGDYRTGNQRGPTGQTWVSLLGQEGINVKGRYNTEFAPIHQVKVQLQIPGRIAFNRIGARDAIKAMQNWSYPVEKDEEGRNRIKPGAKPQHNKWSHFCKAFCYGIDWNYGRQYGRNERITEEDWDFKVFKSVANL